MSEARRNTRTIGSLYLELFFWTLMFGLGVFEIGWQPWRLGGIGGVSIWLQVAVSLLSMGKVVWNIRTGDR